MKAASLLRSAEPAKCSALDTFLNRLGRPSRWLIAAAIAMGTSLAPAFAEDAPVPAKDNKAQIETPAPKAAGARLARIFNTARNSLNARGLFFCAACEQIQTWRYSPRSIPR